MSSFEVADSEISDELIVRIDGYAGPLDALLQMAQTRKVDLTQISVFALCEQYLVFVERSEALHIEAASDALVSAAWLVYLKSRLLLAFSQPQEGDDSTEKSASQIKFRMMRLEAMRCCAAQLMQRPLLGRDVFSRGAPEPMITDEDTKYEVSLYDFLRTYGEHQVRRNTLPWNRPPLEIISVDKARDLLQQALANCQSRQREWVDFKVILRQCVFRHSVPQRSFLASAFCAALVLVREGEVEVQQLRTFGVIHLRRGRSRGQQPRQ